MLISAQHRKEIRNGFKTTGNILLGIITMVLVLAGTNTLSGGDPGRFSKPGAFAGFIVGLGILYWKSERWSGWVAGFFGVPGLWNSLIVFSSGHSLRWPYKPVPRIDALALLGYSIGLIILTDPFSKSHRPLDMPSRVCLVGAVVGYCFAVSFVILNKSSFYLWLAVSLLLFGFARYRKTRHPVSRDHQSSAPLARP